MRTHLKLSLPRGRLTAVARRLLLTKCGRMSALRYTHLSSYIYWCSRTNLTVRCTVISLPQGAPAQPPYLRCRATYIIYVSVSRPKPSATLRVISAPTIPDPCLARRSGCTSCLGGCSGVVETLLFTLAVRRAARRVVFIFRRAADLVLYHRKVMIDRYIRAPSPPTLVI